MNYEIQNNTVAEDLQIRVKIPEGKNVKKITLFSPDIEVNTSVLTWQKNEEWVSFRVPFVYTYDFLVIQF